MQIKKSAGRKKLFRIAIIVIALIIISSVTFAGLAYLDNQSRIQNEKRAENARVLATKAKAAAIEAKKKEPVYITLPGAKPIRAIVDDYTVASSIWAIVGKTHPISVDYAPPLLKIPNVETRTDKSDPERSVRSDIETPLVNMFSAASTEGHQIMIGSGYRSATLQAVYFNSLASSVGDTAANQSIARPGQSEHQTGLAVDLSTVNRNCYLNECFATTGDGQWLAANSFNYGFILRYPKGSETITGYQYEPWHFRYVGIDLATALYESNLTLDEAWPYLQTADATLHKNGAIQ